MPETETRTVRDLGSAALPQVLPDFEHAELLPWNKNKKIKSKIQNLSYKIFLHLSKEEKKYFLKWSRLSTIKAFSSQAPLVCRNKLWRLKESIHITKVLDI